MSIGLLLPSALFALAALLVPLLVHLVRQSEQKRIEFAALRWLVARAQPQRRPRFNEWLLLVLRLLLLALVALWLAQPVLSGRPDTRPWLVVHPAISPARVPPATDVRQRRHWLAPGFPSLDQPTPSGNVPIGSLLRELDAQLPAGVALTVLVPEQFDASDAQRPQLSHAITWTPVPGTSSFDAPTSSDRTQVAVYADAAHRQAMPYLRAAAAAWASEARPAQARSKLRELSDPAQLQANDTQLIWLASTAVPAQLQQWVRDGGVLALAQDSAIAHADWNDARVTWRGIDGTPLALRLGDGKGAWVRMLVPFTPQSLPALLEPDFPRALQGVLETMPPVDTRAWADSYAPGTGNIAPYPQPPRPLETFLALLIAVLFGIERWLAASARRASAR